ncbi:hypothetical protein UFOVP636_49 [uncultured Caudovirales phage]|uniref:SO2946-like C-terminal domain-containing protein n=1 Tax=uncultured Caudovirales phage TaxID=2100421 RepID=A0A6J5N4L8_9CAUD|nr:hypothetical protein UFOVP636_49 [uncultured Caudovirales phage]
MSNLNSYNQLINRFKAFADGHFLLKNFTYGAITLADLQKFGLYPFMHIVPVDVSYETGVKNFSFDVFFADLPRDEENKAEYQKETLSDLQQIAEDLLGEITNHRVLFGYDCSVISSRLVPFEEEFSNVLTGWNLSITLQIPYNWSACDTPASFNDYIVYNQSTGESAILEFTDSIVREGGEVRLVNDVEFPDESYYYGTDENGNRGWFAFPTETGLTCETLGACSTIIDIQTNITNLQDDVEDISANVVDIQMDITTIEGNITTLQTDVSDLETEVGLKANTSDISAVGFSNDYNDLDNLPTIPDAQIQSDWNQINNAEVDFIKNKPTIPTSTDFVEDAINDGVTTKAPSENAVYDALALKFNIPTGTTTDYLDGTGTPTPFPSGTSASLISHEVKLGSTMTKGTPVYVSSADGTNMVVSPASYSSEATSSKTMGLLMEGGNTNAKVQVITEGLLDGLNTSTATIGDAVWLGSTGTLIYGLANKPYAPLHLVFIGIVTRVNINNGEIFVKVQNGFELDEIHNVATAQSKSTPVDADAVLLYDSADANLLWKKLTWSNIKATLKTYFDSLYQATLGFTPENIANKQNSLAIDGTGTKYASVDAVNSLSMIDRGKARSSFFSDFIGPLQASMDGISSILSGGSLSTSQTLSGIGFRSSNQLGFASYQSGTLNFSFVFHIGNTIPNISFGNGVWNFETSILFPAISVLIDRYRTTHGFGSVTGNTDETNGVFFTYDEGGTINGTTASANWQCVSVAGSVRTLTTTSVPVSNTSWTKLQISVNANATSVSYYINGTLVATHTTNIPTFALSQYVFMKQGIAKATGTSNRFLHCDYLGYENILTTPRV